MQRKRVVAAQTKFNVENGRFTEVDRKRRRITEVDILGVHVSKVDALRRAQRGENLARSESSDWLVSASGKLEIFACCLSKLGN